MTFFPLAHTHTVYPNDELLPTHSGHNGVYNSNIIIHLDYIPS
jgi:hypothetical protein